MEGNLERRALLVCETRHVLLYYLMLKLTEYEDTQVDLALTDTTNWGNIPDLLRKEGLFDCIFSLGFDEINKEQHLYTKAQRNELQKDPRARFPQLPPTTYTDVWFNLPGYATQLLWWSLTLNGHEANIHFIEEGTASYTMKPFNSESSIGNWVGTHSYIEHMRDIWLMHPSLRCVDGIHPIETRQLDASVVTDIRFKKIIDRIYPKPTYPERKVVFFEECYIRNGHSVNDLELLERIARAIGKDRILVRLHPKSQVDRFTPAGFMTSLPDGSLWELCCLGSDLSDYLFLTIKSSAATSALTLAKVPPTTIVLNQLTCGFYPNRRSADFSSFLQSIQASLSSDRVVLYTPNSLEELDMIMKVINLEHQLY